MNNNFDDILDNEVKLSEEDEKIIKEINEKNEYKEINLFSNYKIFFSQLIRIAVLFVIAIILVISIRKILSLSGNKNSSLKKELLHAAYNYTWMEDIELDVGEEIKVDFDELIDKSLIKEEKRLRNCTGYVLIKNNNKSDYNYKLYMSCP